MFIIVWTCQRRVRGHFCLIQLNRETLQYKKCFVASLFTTNRVSSTSHVVACSWNTLHCKRAVQSSKKCNAVPSGRFFFFCSQKKYFLVNLDDSRSEVGVFIKKSMFYFCFPQKIDKGDSKIQRTLYTLPKLLCSRYQLDQPPEWGRIVFGLQHH